MRLPSRIRLQASRCGVLDGCPDGEREIQVYLKSCRPCTPEIKKSRGGCRLMKYRLISLFVLIGLLLAAPAPGATNVLSLAKKGVKTATKAMGLAKRADKRARANARSIEALRASGSSTE